MVKINLTLKYPNALFKGIGTQFELLTHSLSQSTDQFVKSLSFFPYPNASGICADGVRLAECC